MRGQVCGALCNGVHGEGARAFEPKLISGTLEQFKKGIAIAGRAVTKSGAVCQRPGTPASLSRFEQEIVDWLRQPGETRHHARRAVAVLEQHGCAGRSGRTYGLRPIYPSLAMPSCRDQRVGNATRPHCPHIWLEERATANERESIPRKPVHSSDHLDTTSIKILRPQPTSVIRLISARALQRDSALAIQIRPSTFTCQIVHREGRQHGARRAPHKL